jgi:hypothetical protein
LRLHEHLQQFPNLIPHHYKKTRPAGVRQPRALCLKRRHSHAGRENLRTPAPTHTQRHRSSHETGLTLDMCFGVGQTRVFFSMCR